MLTIATLIAAGPCLIASMAAIALFIVHRSLSQVRHALIWSAAFATTALRWAVIARFGTEPSAPAGGLGFNPLGIIAIVLLAEGFRLRAKAHHMRWVIRIAAIFAVPIQIAAYRIPSLPLRAALIPLLAGLMIGWSTTLVVPRDRRTSVAELTVVLILALLAMIELGGAGLAIAEQMGVMPASGLYAQLFAITLQPICAALGMSTLLLIAFDFSAEQQWLIHTDPLTGVLNRLGFEQAARAAMARKRRARPITIALTDLDSFKGINDCYGHAAGDQTLVGFARHLEARLERDEVVGRFGGEEFALLLPGSDGPAALARIEKMRTDLAELVIDDATGLAVAASFGVAEYQPGEALSRVVERADEALYRSKREGRNRSTLAPSGDE